MPLSQETELSWRLYEEMKFATMTRIRIVLKTSKTIERDLLLKEENELI